MIYMIYYILKRKKMNVIKTNFYKVLYSELEKNPAVQCFSGRRVLYMDEPSTKYYYQTESLAHLETSPALGMK